MEVERESVFSGRVLRLFASAKGTLVTDTQCTMDMKHLLVGQGVRQQRLLRRRFETKKGEPPFQVLGSEVAPQTNRLLDYSVLYSFKSVDDPTGLSFSHLFSLGSVCRPLVFYRVDETVGPARRLPGCTSRVLSLRCGAICGSSLPVYVGVYG